jgi:hypothetical protein
MNQAQTTAQEIIAQKMKEAPAGLRSFLMSQKYADLVKGIGQKNGLRIDQTSDLFLSVTLVLLGMEPMSKLPDTLREELEIDGLVLGQLIEDINLYVFEEVRGSIEELYKTKMDKINPLDLEKEDVLDEIESPEKVVPQYTPKAKMVDQKMAPSPEITETKLKRETISKNNDPYREPVE